MSQIKYIKGDLFEALESLSKPTLVPHVCNNKGVMGAGIAKTIKEKFPYAYKSYLRDYQLGKTTFYQSDNIIIANMVAQTLDSSIRPLLYNVLSSCMDHVAYHCKEFKIKNIMCPMFGAGLARGNWDFIMELVYDCWIRQELNVTIYYL